ncbi:MAG: SAM-dependent chlorinase/fluorinase [Planctomycetes bacterium]|nr:SAM-dependent chlorinase/fluorinase [Planctomycetota bacterium]
MRRSLRAPFLVTALFAFALLGCGCPPGQSPDDVTRAAWRRLNRRPVILLTDFGARDDSVALLRGVILSIAPDAQILDLTHEVPPYDIEEGARLLEEAPGVYPAGTVFVAVVDPGVGTERKPLAVRLANGNYLVGPDNGLLSAAMARHGVSEVREITDARFRRPARSATFHGRDVFAPAGAQLALGSPAFEEIGPRVTDWVRLAAPASEFVPATAGAGARLRGAVVAIDQPYGNLWTNLTPEDLAKLPAPVPAPARAQPTWLAVSCGEPARRLLVPLVSTFGDVPEQQPLAYWNSRGRLALALNMGDAARAWSVARGARLEIEAVAAPPAGR